MARVCNTCKGSGVVKDLDEWGGEGKRDQPCWHCHEAPDPAPANPVYRELIPELRAALLEAIEAVATFHGPFAWEEYRESPEMKRWRAVIEKCEAVDADL